MLLFLYEDDMFLCVETLAALFKWTDISAFIRKDRASIAFEAQRAQNNVQNLTAHSLTTCLLLDCIFLLKIVRSRRPGLRL